MPSRRSWRPSLSAEDSLPVPSENRTSVQLREVEARIHEAKREATRHGLFTLLGASPATLIPMLGVGVDFGMGALLAASVLVSGLEGWRWFRADREVKQAEADRERLAGEQAPGSDDD